MSDFKCAREENLGIEGCLSDSGANLPVEIDDGIIACAGCFKAVYQHEKKLALTDFDTQLPNRRHLNQKIEAYKQLKVPFALISADLVGLKTVNDNINQAAGDTAIRRAARALEGRLTDLTIRLENNEDADGTEELAARTGGDEFAVLVAIHRRKERTKLKVPKLTDEEMVRATAERFKKAFMSDPTIQDIQDQLPPEREKNLGIRLNYAIYDEELHQEDTMNALLAASSPKPFAPITTE